MDSATVPDMLPNRKIQFYQFISVLALILMIGLGGCKSGSPQTSEPVPTEIIIGYCPTMTPYAQEMAGSYQNLLVVQYANSSAAMQALHAGKVHAVLIGRSAWENEMNNNLRLVRIIDGYVLIAAQPAGILYEDLAKIRILTHERETELIDLLPAEASITYYQDYDHMLANLDGSSAIALRWSQMSPRYNLLIPVDTQGNKIITFRSPHFYYMEEWEEFVLPIVSDKVE